MNSLSSQRASSSSTLRIEEVRSTIDQFEFLSLPWKVYKDDHNWAAPLWSEHARYFDRSRNVELDHIDFQRFNARRAGEVVGSVIAHINRKYNDHHKAQTGWFGQFEVMHDPEAAYGLLETAEDWLRERGADKMMGPATFSSNSEWGLLIKGHEHPQMIMTTHAKPYYEQFICAHGFRKAMDLFSWYYNLVKQPQLPPQITRIADRLKRQRRYRIYHPSKQDWDNEAKRALEIFSQAWQDNWGFVPFSATEQNHLSVKLKPLIDLDLVVFVEKEGRPVAFAAPLVNVFQPLRHARMRANEFAWWQMMRLLWQWKVRRRVNSLRVLLMGVVKDHRGKGLDALMYREMFEAAKRKGFEHVEMSWVLENNSMMNRATASVGSDLYKIHRVYEKAL